MTTAKQKSHLKWQKILFYLAILILFAIFVVPKTGQIHQGIKVASQANFGWILLAIGSLALTYFAAALVYLFLAKLPLKYLKTVAVQLATSFTNRLVPGGFGGIGLNVDYLMKNKHQPSEASSVVTTNTIVALTSHILLLTGALIIGNISPKLLVAGKTLSPRFLLLVALVIFVIILSLNWRQNLWLKITSFIKKTWAHVVEYRNHPLRLILALLGATAITMLFVTALYASAHASGLPVSFIQAFIAYTAGVLIGAAVLTPGGLVGVEAGLFAALVSFKFDSSLVFSTIIIFRLLAFWLPIVPGYISFLLLRKYKVV